MTYAEAERLVRRKRWAAGTGGEGGRAQTWTERLPAELEGRLDRERIHVLNRL